MIAKTRWKKLGLIFCPSKENYWMHSHAAVPIAENISGDLFRIYFSTRDDSNRSYTAYVVININQPNNILEISDSPVLGPGALGEFDDSGAMGSWITEFEGRRFLYYIGWNLAGTVPFRNSIGIASSEKGGRFERKFSGPIVDRTHLEPHFCASCCVLKDGDIWRMWYLSCTEWRVSNSRPEHRYHIKYAESKNGIDWQRQGLVAIDYLDEHEIAISRPSVVKDGDLWKMWFSYRSTSTNYQIGYAESLDAKTWKRSPGHVLERSEHGWDSIMMEYPYVFDHEGRRYMLYNGNGYGFSGFGLAVFEDEK